MRMNRMVRDRRTLFLRGAVLTRQHGPVFAATLILLMLVLSTLHENWERSAIYRASWELHWAPSSG